MKISFQIIETFPVSAVTIYEAWLNSEKHSQMTGGAASCSNKEGEPFTAWDGYISGKNLKLDPAKEITQSWRTTEFPEKDEDSKLTIKLKDVENGCEITLIHENIPAGQHSYKSGWVEHYLDPMKNYFVGK